MHLSIQISEVFTNELPVTCAIYSTETRLLLLATFFPLESDSFVCFKIFKMRLILCRFTAFNECGLLFENKVGLNWTSPISVAARSKARFYGHTPAGFAGSNPAGDMNVCLL